MNIENNKSLKNYNTFGIDASADKYVEIFDEEELKDLFSRDDFKRENIMILGGGSNILLTGDYRGLVIKNSIPGIKIIYEDNETALVKAGAGVIWNDLVLFSIEKNLGGAENLILIPGTVGAAPIQNIGAYGQELKNIFHSLKGIYIYLNEEAIYEKDDCCFSYRDSIFKKELKGKFIITYVILSLTKNPKPVIDYGNIKTELEKLGKENYTIEDVGNVITQIRREKLPDPVEIGNAGSFFKNPIVDYKQYSELKHVFNDLPGYEAGDGKMKIPAGWLIEKCGWKGKRIKDTGVHANQALVLVNYGNSSGKDILSFAWEIRASVFNKFRIELVQEVNIY
jgi:UDP-N-acetylmuramate dehydrogenase